MDLSSLEIPSTNGGQFCGQNQGGPWHTPGAAPEETKT